MKFDERHPLKSVALSPGSCTPSRRVFLADCGMGLTGLVLGAILQRDGKAATTMDTWAPPDGKTDWWPNVESVIDEVALIQSMYTTDNDHDSSTQAGTCLTATCPQ
jgi:hypothetical protein